MRATKMTRMTLIGCQAPPVVCAGLGGGGELGGFRSHTVSSYWDRVGLGRRVRPSPRWPRLLLAAGALEPVQGKTLAWRPELSLTLECGR